MPSSVLEQFATKLQTQLETITTDNGYSESVKMVVRPNQRSEWLNPESQEYETLVQDGSIVITRGERRKPDDAEAMGCSEYVQVFELHRIVMKDEDEDASIDTFIDVVVADIEKCLLNSPAWYSGTYFGVYEVKVIGDDPLPDGPACDGRTVRVECYYRTLYGDPFTGG